MKKRLIFISCLIIIVLIFIVVKYNNYKGQKMKIQEFNIEYEQYLNKEIYGTEVATVINKAIDNNERNNVEKNEEGYYIENDKDSVTVDVKITDNDTLYKMETFYDNEIVRFVQNYNYILFKCTKIDYNSSGKVKYLFFEQVSTN